VKVRHKNPTQYQIGMIEVIEESENFYIINSILFEYAALPKDDYEPVLESK
jgi:hypothetical protein